jgi:hypothetical protein
MNFQRKVARIEELDFGTGNVASERLGTRGQEKGIVLFPRRQETCCAVCDTTFDMNAGWRRALHKFLRSATLQTWRTSLEIMFKASAPALATVLIATAVPD